MRRPTDGQLELASRLVGPFERAGQAAHHHLAHAVDVDVVAEWESVEQRAGHRRLSGRQLAADDEDGWRSVHARESIH